MWIPNYVLVSGNYVQSGQINVSTLPYNENGYVIYGGTISAGETDIGDSVASGAGQPYASYILDYGTASGTFVDSGGQLAVYYSAVGTVVSGGQENIDGGTSTSGTIEGQGYQGVNSG